MKFNKGESYTYFVQTVPDPELLEGIVTCVKDFVNGTSKQIEKDGRECDEYDILYSVSHTPRDLEMWFVLNNDKRGLLILGFPINAINDYKPEEFKTAIESVLKED